ncbi:hypothetical protein G3N95_40050 [Paraburkholderia sp. Tr-20389]|uniref:hypothetical protein n=1 Tax=Paraburkholderia sp. Tr-20389 TaxID=2703903 RepID=UPI00197DEDC9|nr:hypothetical protein [Paraburkholderia sp. Tr-20389]MBN3759157.1 hypothetical protein [Paraburkholderia sp. Tr-20389]
MSDIKFTAGYRTHCAESPWYRLPLDYSQLGVFTPTLREIGGKLSDTDYLLDKLRAESDDV